MHQRYTKQMAIVAVMTVLLAACSSKEPASEAQGNEPVATSAPATLDVFIPNETVSKLIQEKFPQHTIRVATAKKINELITAGIVPDIISYTLGGISDLKGLQLMSDLTPLIQKYQFDLNRFLPGVMETVKSYADNNNDILLMPFELNNTALFYNKNIFDKFGVPYPKDGLTWEELLDISRKVTRLDNGVQYKGFRFEETNILFRNQLGLAFVDSGTGKSTINTAPWKRWMQVMMAFYQVPGNEMEVRLTEKDAFLKNQTLAMRTGPNFLSDLPAAAENGLNFDFVSLPHFAGEDKGSQLNAPYYTIPPTSKNKGQAFEIIAYLLSDEVQTIMAREGHIPIVKSEKVIQEFGKGIDAFNGKNLAAFFKEKVAAPAGATEFDTIVKTAMVKTAMRGVGVSKKDINTALRETEEEVNTAIQNEIKK